MTKDLSLTIQLHEWRDWDCLFVSFLERVAHLGHFERLCLSIQFWQGEDRDAFQFDRLTSVAAALNGAVKANTNSTCLDLRDSHFYLDWGLHLEDLHKSLRTFLVNFPSHDYTSDDEDDDSNLPWHPLYSWIEMLLSRNRSIDVLNL